jgi:hypothetical protein
MDVWEIHYKGMLPVSTIHRTMCTVRAPILCVFNDVAPSEREVHINYGLEFYPPN